MGQLNKQEISAKVLLDLPPEVSRAGPLSIYRNSHHLSFLQHSLFHDFSLISFSSHFQYRHIFVTCTVSEEQKKYCAHFTIRNSSQMFCLDSQEDFGEYCKTFYPSINFRMKEEERETFSFHSGL